jgi:hypothetical protein
MSHLLIGPPWSSDSSTLIDVPSGGRLRFGRGGPGHSVDMRLPYPGVSRDAGEVTAAGAFWFLSNHSARATYVVENPEGAGEYLRVAPRRVEVPIPFEIARVSLPTAEATVSFLVYAPEQPYSCVPTAEPDGDRGRRTEPTLPMDTEAKYFLVLVALCEPRLRHGGLAPVPTNPEVVRRLRALPNCARLTREAVDFHLDYVARAKFRLRQGVQGFASRREAVVGFALRFGVVTEEHLRLLPARERGGSTPAHGTGTAVPVP